MNSFANAVQNQEARTANGMKARQSTANACVDLFFNFGASRGKDITAAFTAAFVENADIAMRIAQWGRDIRGGAGERQLFKDVLSILERSYPEKAIKLITKVPELGRWDDMLINYSNKEVECFAFDFYFQGLINGNKLAGKWAPRKGEMALKLQKHWSLSPKQYRKLLVNNTDVVETKMCAKQWDKINFSHVPSVASARYKSAFYRNAEQAYSEYVAKLTSGDKTVKVNASAVYPYDVVKGLGRYTRNYNMTELGLIEAQWNALPNYLGEDSILPMVDVSGSMGCPAGNNSNVSCLDVAVSLGLYCSEKNKGAFKDIILTFTGKSDLLTLKGNIVQRYAQLSKADWEMNTNLHAAFSKVLQVAQKGNVADKDMPKTILILSDMQFDSCVRYDDSAIQMIRRKYEQAGYTMPNVVFWNLSSYGNAPVAFDESGTALVSGFSPSILKSVLGASFEDFTPQAIMLKTLMVERYDWQ